MPWTKADVDKHKKGLSDAKKEQWVAIANSVRQKCLDDGGSEEDCDAKAIRQANGAVINNNKHFEKHSVQANSYTIRTTMHQGRKHIVVPVVMMVEGVHNGSHGPLLHTITELGKYPDVWNGIPVCIGHPSDGNLNISANSPDVIDNEIVGRVYNTHVDGPKLKAEAWLDEQRMNEKAPQALGYIRENRPLDVSIGVFTDDEAAEGQWNGETYTAVARNHRPDHLALLPGGVGACSWADGCGVRVNAKGGTVDVSKKLMTLADLAKEGKSVLLNEFGHQEIAMAIQTKLDRMDDDTKKHYLHDVFDDYFVYEKSNSNDNGYELFKRTYTVNEDDGSVEFTGEAIPVVRKVDYVAMEKGMKRTKMPDVNKKGGIETMGKNDEKKSCCPEKVELLIQSEHSQFVEEDRELLESFDQTMIDKLVAPVANLEAASEEKTEEKKEDVGVNKEEAIKVLQEQLKTPEQFIGILPESMRDMMNEGLKLHQEKRQVLISKIVAHSDAFTEKELASKDMAELEKIGKLIPEKADYSVFAGGVKVNTNSEEVLLPPGVGTKQ